MAYRPGAFGGRKPTPKPAAAADPPLPPKPAAQSTPPPKPAASPSAYTPGAFKKKVEPSTAPPTQTAPPPQTAPPTQTAPQTQTSPAPSPTTPPSTTTPTSEGAPQSEPKPKAEPQAKAAYKPGAFRKAPTPTTPQQPAKPESPTSPPEAKPTEKAPSPPSSPTKSEKSEDPEKLKENKDKEKRTLSEEELKEQAMKSLSEKAADIQRIQQEYEKEREEAAKEQEQIILTPTAKIHRLYAGCRPERQNLFTKMAATQMFIIEGDSLVAEIIANTTVDFQHGGQLLQLIFLTERYLQLLVERGGVFQIVFFTCHRVIWKDYPFALVFREALVQHLIHHCAHLHNFKVSEFENYWSDDYFNYMVHTNPGFVLLNDGEQLAGVYENQSRPCNVPPTDDVVEPFKLDEVPIGSLLFRIFMLHCLTRFGEPKEGGAQIPPNVHVAFTGRLMVKGNKTEAFVVRATHELKEIWLELWDDAHRLAAEHTTPVIQYVVPEPHSAALTTLQSQMGFRTSAHILSCASVLNDPLTRGQHGKQVSDLVKAVILHSVVLDQTPSLQHRAQPLPRGNMPDIFYTFFDTYCKYLAAVLPLFSGDASNEASSFGILDVLDGRILCKLLFFCASNNTLDSLGLTNEGVARAKAAVTELNKLAGLKAGNELDISATALCPGWPSLPTGEEDTLPSMLSDNRLHPNELALKLTKMTELEHAPGNSDKIEDAAVEALEANPHWTEEDDNFRNLEEFKEGEEQQSDRWKAKNMAQLVRYATSLEGGRFIRGGECLTVTKDDKDDKKKDKKKEKEKKEKDKKKEKEDKKKEREDKKKPPAGGKNKKPSRKEEIMAATGAAKEAKELQKSQAQWKNILTEFGKLNRQQLISHIDVFLKGKQHPDVALEARFHKLGVINDTWKDHCGKAPPTQRDLLIAATVFQCAHDVLHFYNFQLPPERATYILEILICLGLKDNAKLCSEKLGVNLPPVPPSKILSVGRSAPRLELEIMGHLLRRPVSDESDERVGFHPDQWQRQLLDIVDTNESALVCAPTSAGKTFISFYAMKKVIRASDDGLVIFVAPNRQLCHQVKADVYAQFQSKTYKHAGMTLFGEFSENMWENVQSCQVLITTPKQLQVLLTSSVHYKWVEKRLRYLIVDEVHCIDEHDFGAMWERILVLTRCPFLALSATIGNFDEFHGWLQRVQDMVQQHEAADHRTLPRPSYEVHRVPDGKNTLAIKRWSDLQKYVFMPGTPEQRNEWQTVYPKVHRNALAPLHPCARLTVQNLAVSGFPGDLAFVPRESVELYDAMLKVAIDCKDEKLAADLKAKYDPDIYYKANPYIIQKEAREYEELVKTEIQSWSSCPTRAKYCTAVLGLLGSDINKQLESAVAGSKGAVHGTIAYLKEHLLDLIVSLGNQAKLPCLMFNFEESTCRDLVEHLTVTLETRERTFKDTDEFKAMLKSLEIRRAAAAKRQKQLDKTLAGMASSKGEDGDSRESVEKVDQADRFADLSDLGDLGELDILPQFTLVRSKAGDGMEEEELAQILAQVEKKLGSRDDILYRCLLRGIGIHHNGLSYKYRQCVEMLFRAKQIKVVICTETMALGIHMPCKSVVFLGDHLGLNPLQYRQMSGRAGRRGFDLLGHVIFYGIPDDKITRLMTSEMTRLRGHWPLTSGVTHRLLHLYNSTKKHPKLQTRVGRQISSIWEVPMMPIRGSLQNTTDQVKLYFNTCMDFLMSQGCINSSASPLLLSDFTAKMFEWEPANYMVAALLKSKALTPICEQWIGWEQYEATSEIPPIMKRNEKPITELLLVLCHILGRREIHRSALLDVNLGTLDSEKVHQLVLPAIPLPEVKQTMELQHRRAIEVMTVHAINASNLPFSKHSKATQLPCSTLTYPQTESEAQPDKNTFMGKLQEDGLSFKCRSPFAGLSGRGDVYQTLSELIQSVRDGIYLDHELFPSLELRDTYPKDGGTIPLNACVYDYQHSVSQQDLETVNGLSFKESWEDLDNFIRALRRFTRLATQQEVGAEKAAIVPDTGVKVADSVVCNDLIHDGSKLLKILILLLHSCNGNNAFADTKGQNALTQKKQLQQTKKKQKRPPLIKKPPRR